MDKLPYKEEILEDDGTMIKLCEQAALRIELVRLITAKECTTKSNYDAWNVYRDRVRVVLESI